MVNWRFGGLDLQATQFPKPGPIQPAICELWWAHLDMLEHHLGDVVVPRDTQQHTLGIQMYFPTFFNQFWVPLGTYLEVILLAFPAVGHPFCLWASGV